MIALFVQSWSVFAPEPWRQAQLRHTAHCVRSLLPRWLRGQPGPAGPGCRAPQPADPAFPLTNVELTLVQGDRTWALGTADADDRDGDRDQLYKISWTTTVPSDVPAGPAELRAATASLNVELT